MTDAPAVHTADFARLADLTGSLVAPNVLIVGDVMLDWYITGTIDRISPEAPVPVLHVRQDAETAELGGAANVAANVQTLGGRAVLVGAVGTDEPGQFTTEWLRRLLAAQRIRTRGLVEVAGRPTTLKTRIIGLAQNRIPQQMMRVDRENSEPLPEVALDAIGQAIAAELDSSDVVCFEDYRKGVLAPARLPEWIDMCRHSGKTVLVDPAPIADYTRYRGATWITPNRKETSLACGGAKIDGPADAARLLPAVLRLCGIAGAIVTLDREGCLVVPAEGPAVHVPTRPRDVFDVTGAGDSVLAALAVTLAAGWDVADAAAWANVVGGLEVSRFGCVAIRRDEVLGELLALGRRGRKLLAVSELLPMLDRERSLGRRIVFTNGCFDLLHVGHVEYLAHCRTLGDVVVVGVNSDASVRRQGKRGDRPINAEGDRVAMLAALADVDYVVVFDDDTPRRVIEAVQPDVLVKGQDYAGKEVVGSDVVTARGGRVVLAPFKPGYSTTTLAERIARTVHQ